MDMSVEIMKEDLGRFLLSFCEPITEGDYKLRSVSFSPFKNGYDIVLVSSENISPIRINRYKRKIENELYKLFNLPPFGVFIEFKTELDSSDQYSIPLTATDCAEMEARELLSRNQTPRRIFTLSDINSLVEEIAGYISLECNTSIIVIQNVSVIEDFLTEVVKVEVAVEVSDSRVADCFKGVLAKSLMDNSCPYVRFDLQLHCTVRPTPAMVEFKLAFKEENNMKQLPEVKKIIHSGDYTHIIWEDDTKTTVKRAEDTPYDAYSAFAQAVVKKLYGSTEKAKFEHELRQLSAKEQKKVLAEKEARKAKQEKREKKKLDRQLAQQEKELKEKEEQVQKTRAKRQSMFKRSAEV